MARRKKVRVHRLTTVYQTKNNRERVPLVRMSGKWLAAVGFEEGSRYTAFSEDEGRIILTVYRPAPRKRVQGGRA
jgi:hypothetical protein